MTDTEPNPPNPDPLPMNIKNLKRKVVMVARQIAAINDKGRIALNDPSPANVNVFKGMHMSLNNYWDKFENSWFELFEAYDAINKPTSFPSKEEANFESNTRRYYYEANSTFITLSGSAGSSTNANHGGVSEANVTLNESVRTSNLPKIPLPPFDGKILNWPKFKDAFVSIIHSDPTISQIEKFHYLLGAVSGAAHTIVSKLPLVSENYHIAWTNLTEAYDNKRLLAAAYLNELVNFKPLTGKPSISSYQLFLTKVAENVSAFDRLKVESSAEFILFHLAIKTLDPLTREQFEIESKDVQFPTFQNLSQFVRSRCLAMQLAEQNLSTNTTDSLYSNRTSNNNGGSSKVNSPANSKHRYNTHSKSTTTLLANKDSNAHASSRDNSGAATNNDNVRDLSCVICKQSHKLLDCFTFTNATNEQRINWLKTWNGCKNCLSPFHITSACKSLRHCRFCSGKHHSMLHMEYKRTQSQQSAVSPVSANMHTISAQGSQVLLGTIVAEIEDAYGNYQRIRMVIDSGSQSSFITKKCLDKLSLNAIKIPNRVSCLGNTIFEGIKGKVTCSIRPRDTTSPTFVTDAFVVQKITNNLPNVTFCPNDWNRYVSYQLADDKFWESNSVDFLMGCDLAPEIWTGEIITIDESRPKLFSSVFGYVVCGKINANDLPNSTMLFTCDTANLHDELQKFWELEEPTNTKFSNPEDDDCEKYFVETHFRDSDGRYVVSLPFKNKNPFFGPSAFHALRRLTNLERKLQRNDELSRQYKTFMREYLEMGHMEPTKETAKYIIPHHSIVKEDRNVIKLRVVFDASARTSSGSLNDQLMTGPKLQTDIRDILLKWRIHKVVLVADLVKMYRHILINPKDRIYQHIYWRFDESDPVEEYQLTTLTYGISSAPYLALRTMLQLKLDEGDDFSMASKVIPNDMYIDDLVTGTDSLSEALQLKRELVEIFGRGGFYLDKWASNVPELLRTESCANDDAIVSFSFNDEANSSIKILGLQWNSNKDVFFYSISPPPIITTKRLLLSSIAKIYDPLGFLAPTVFLAKSFLQALWKSKLDWDDPIPDVIRDQWSQFVSQLPDISKIQIPRMISDFRPFRYQIVGFCDASERGYGASFYIRIFEDDFIKSHLLIAKTKLAPIKALTIPRLELCSALLLAKLFDMLSTFLSNLPTPELPPVFFTDSTIVLCWLKTPTYSLKTFVANRVNEILNITACDSWRHVRTEENPSDCCSRGLMPHDLVNHHLWWRGPQWLKRQMTDWPQIDFIYPKEVPECKSTDSSLTTLLSTPCFNNLEWMSKYSSFTKLMTFVGTILRFIHNKTNPADRKFGPLKAQEYKKSEEVCVRLVQLKYFFEGDLNKNKNSIFQRFHKLSPYFDSLGILRVGGRLNNADLPTTQKHPVILPKKSHFTILLIDYYHKLYLHPGPGLLQALLQLKFWVPSLRQLIRSRTFLCLTCFKDRNANRLQPPQMGDLPDFRVSPGRVFQHTGIDFGGPFSTRESLRRKAAIGKSYLCLFICMQTKALHLEVVSSLTTEAFLAAMSRFISKHGVPEAIYSDRGTNFQGAASYLKELRKWFDHESTKNSILQFCHPKQIRWHFNPAKAPHFGGLWEAGIKSVKGHLRRVIGETKLTYEELDTLFKAIEAILNSRPLCPLSSSPEEVNFLSPAHFLIGDNLMSYPEPSLLDLRENRLSRWQLVKQKIQHIWQRWRNEYLSTLQQKTKWTSHKKQEVKEGTLVLLKGDSPVTQWPLGRVAELHPGKDGICRVATVRTANSSFRRPLVQLVPLLPLSQNPYDVET